ncbi:alpha/beta fold hydrolase [Variovorax sp. GT1P44]|uniref:alpha/beta fold hydrolase n=1 Tax=Variovorax sp. GT1P44 TaxID=3443742 RepID=UPI003F464E49
MSPRDELPPPTLQWTAPDGVRLAGDAWGDPAGPLVVLLHGGGQTRHAWKNAGKSLGRRGYHAVAFDARGHGDSEWSPQGDYSQDAMVSDLRLVVDALGGGRAALVGASMGGGTSLVAAGEGRIDASALILVDMAPRLEVEGVDRIRAFMTQKPEGFASLQEVADAIALYQPQRSRPASLHGLRKNVRLTPEGRYRWHWDPKFMSGKADLQRMEQRMSAAARSLSLPALLIRGGLSDVLSEQGAEDFLSLYPRCEYVNIDGAAHMIAGDRNDAFARSLISFLERNVPATPLRPS